MSRNGINIFSYQDFRKFLREWYLSSKEKYGFSYRVFSRLAGFTSSNIFKLVMEGRRNLTEDSIKKFAKGLKLSRAEAEYFRTLVLFNQAEKHEEKNLYYQKLIRTQRVQELQPLIQDRYEYYSTWYHPVIRELVVAKDFDGTMEWIARRLEPEVSAAQARKSIELLERMHFIKKDPETHRWSQDAPLVTSGVESDQLVLLNYHRSLLELMKEQVGRVPQAERDVSALTLGVMKDRLPQLKKRIQEFRREILQMVSEDHNPDDVVLLGIQLLPVTKHEKAAKAAV
jgi:uncharacterized protein (TIGR02147 family)